MGASSATAGITVTLGSPQTAYVIGSNTFTFNVGLTYSGLEYVDRYQFVFPNGVTVTSGTPASGAGTSGSDNGVQGIAGNIISWSTSGVPATGTFPKTNNGTYNEASSQFTVTVNVPANFVGPLVVTLNSIGDGYQLTAGTPDQDAVTFAAPVVNPPDEGDPCVLVCPADITVNLAPGACEAIVN